MTATDDHRPRVCLLVHGGPGSWTRAAAILQHLDAHATVVGHVPPPASVATRVEHVQLPLPSGDDGAGGGGDGRHLGAQGFAAVQHTLEERRPDLLVADGLADAPALAAAVDVPLVVLRSFADREGEDGSAEAVGAWLAPYPGALEPADVHPEVRQRTVHAGFLSRFESRRSARSAARRRLDIPRDARHATLLGGPDGIGLSRDAVTAITDLADTWSFSVLGRCEETSWAGTSLGGPSGPDGRVRLEGFSADPFAHLAAADVVVCGASLGAVADTVAARRPFCVLVDVEDASAARLGAAVDRAGIGLAVEGIPDPMAWPALLADVIDRDTASLRRLADGRAGRRAAGWIDGWASTPPTPPAAGVPATGSDQVAAEA